MTEQQSGEYCISWDELHRDTRALATRLLDRPWRGIIGIARGGLVPAAILARELELRMVDTLCISSYDHDRQGEINVLKSVDGDGEGFLLVDDLVDTGNTARYVRELLPAACFATVYAKPRGRELTDLFVREFPQDVWLHFPWDIAPVYASPLASRKRV